MARELAVELLLRVVALGKDEAVADVDVAKGIYPLDVELSRAGTYAYRFTSTDPQAVIEGEIEVAKSAF